MISLRLLFVIAILGSSIGTSNADTQKTDIAVKWNPNDVATHCQAASRANGFAYNGKLDILYAFGLSGAEQGTLGEASAVSGLFETQLTPSDYSKVTVSACCLSSGSKPTGIKFRCPSAANVPLTQTEFPLYPVCPSNKTLTLIKALKPDGYLWTDGTTPCSKCVKQGVETNWDAATNQCKSINEPTTGTPPTAPPLSPPAGTPPTAPPLSPPAGTPATIKTDILVKWNPDQVAEKCQAVSRANGVTYNGKIDILYAFGLSGAEQGTLGEASAVSGLFETQLTPSDYSKVTVSACCLASDSKPIGVKFRCFSAADVPLTQYEFPTYPVCPSDKSLTLIKALKPDGYLWTDGTTPCSKCVKQGVETQWDATTSQCKFINKPPTGTPASTKTNIAVKWNPDDVAANCQAASRANGFTYNGKLDILYAFGLSGAEQGTLGEASAVSGSFETQLTPSDYSKVTVSACCLSSDSKPTGIKFRCPSAANVPLTQTEFSLYPVCPSDKTLTLIKALKPDGYLWTDGTTPCSKCLKQGVETNWDAASNQCKTIVSRTF